MSYFRIPSGTSLILNCLLQDGNTARYPLAFVYNTSDMSEIIGSPFSLSHMDEGMYVNHSVGVADGRYLVVYVVYDDVGHTILSARYGRTFDVFDVNDIVNVQAIAEAVWQLSRAGNQPAGSFGEFLNATITSRMSSGSSTRFDDIDSAIASVKSDTLNTLPARTAAETTVSRLTSGRAANLDNLDVAISSRAVATDIAAAVWNASRTAFLTPGSFGEAIDSPISTRASQSSVSSLPGASSIADAVWDELAASHVGAGSFGAQLDVAVSTRQSTSHADSAYLNLIAEHGITQGRVDDTLAEVVLARDDISSLSSDVTSVKAKTDSLSFASGRVIAKAEVVSDKSDYALSSADKSLLIAGIWDETMASHLNSGSTGEKLNNGDAVANASSVADAVWDELRSGHASVGSFGEALDAKVSNMATSTALSSVASGVTALGVQSSTILSQTAPAGIAASVWNEARASHVGAGTFGAALQGVLSAVRASLLDNLSNLDVVVSTRAQQATVDSILAQTTNLDSRLTAGRAVNLDKLDVAVSTRATPITVPTAAETADAVWDEALTAHAVVGSTGEKLSLLANSPSVGAIADAVWDEAGSGHVGAGSFGARLDIVVSTRSSQTSVEDIKGVGFNGTTDSLEKIRDKMDSLPASAGDATLQKQNDILAAIASKSTSAEVSSVHAAVLSIPANPLLTNDSRLNRLDTTISSRASSTEIDSLKGAGYNQTTDSLKAISDTVMPTDLTPVLSVLDDMKGVGFNTATHSLVNIKNAASAAEISANGAATSAYNAYLEAQTKAEEADLAILISKVDNIPTNTVLSSDTRLARLDATISSRATQTSIQDLQGAGFNPSVHNLRSIFDEIDSLSFGDATLAKQDQILSLVGAMSTQISVDNLSLLIAGIPTDPVLTGDPRLDNLDALVSSRAKQTDIDAIKGGGFDSGDSLVSIRDAIDTGYDLTPILAMLEVIKGVGFLSGRDDLVSLNSLATTERAAIKNDTEALLSSGVST